MDDYRIAVTLKNGESRESNYRETLRTLGFDQNPFWDVRGEEDAWKVCQLAKQLKVRFSEIETMRVYSPEGREIYAL